MSAATFAFTPTPRVRGAYRRALRKRNHPSPNPPRARGLWRRPPARAGVRRRGQPLGDPPDPRRRFQGQVLRGAPAFLRSFWASGRPDSPFSPCGRRGMLTGVGFFGKPLHSFSHSGLQDAQTPPSPLVGEGGRGDEGANAHGNVDLPPSPHHQWQVDLPRWRQHQRYGGCDRRR